MAKFIGKTIGMPINFDLLRAADVNAVLPIFVSYGDQSVQAMRTQPISEDRVVFSPMPRAALATPCRLFSPVTPLSDLKDEIEKFSMEFIE